ncbi:CoB--CoM heterodisulfide reductase iron-sulfur subunit B family protein [Candidatus Latescibacterota bacterium]
MDEKAMEIKNNNIALYPGCSLEGAAISYNISLKKSLGELGIDLVDMDDWNCCGATSAHSLDHTLYLALELRNLALAEQQGFSEVLAPCAACYHRLASANFEVNEDAEKLKHINNEVGLSYSGGVKVRNVLDYLANVIGTERIAATVKKPLTGVKAVCYYGCLNTRIPRMESFDVIENPVTMDRITEATGAESMDWSYKTDCCGASLFISSESTATRLVSKILKDAVEREADCIVVACPLCHNNLDTLQDSIRKEYGIERPMPILFVTQLMGIAFGLSDSSLKLNHAFVPFKTPEYSQ